MTKQEVLEAVNEQYRPGGGRVTIKTNGGEIRIIPNNCRGGIVVGHEKQTFDFAWNQAGGKWVGKA